MNEKSKKGFNDLLENLNNINNINNFKFNWPSNSITKDNNNDAITKKFDLNYLNETLKLLIYLKPNKLSKRNNKINFEFILNVLINQRLVNDQILSNLIDKLSIIYNEPQLRNKLKFINDNNKWNRQPNSNLKSTRFRPKTKLFYKTLNDFNNNRHLKSRK